MDLLQSLTLINYVSSSVISMLLQEFYNLTNSDVEILRSASTIWNPTAIISQRKVLTSLWSMIKTD